MSTNRRNFLAGLGAMAPASYFVATQSAAASLPNFDYYADLGVKPFINAIGPYSSLGGAEMWPEVIAAMDYAIESKVRVDEGENAIVGQIIRKTLLAQS